MLLTVRVVVTLAIFSNPVEHDDDQLQHELGPVVKEALEQFR